MESLKDERGFASGDDPIRGAEDQMIDGALRELAGRGPRVDLADRIREDLGRSDRSSLGGRLLVAAVLLVGVGVVALIAARQVGWWTTPETVAAIAPQDPVQDPIRDPVQDPIQGQAPSEAEIRVIEQRIAELGAAQTREAAFAALAAIGARAVPQLCVALERERKANRPRLVEQIQRVLVNHLPYALAKMRMGFAPDEPLILIADYADNQVFAVDRDGKRRFALDEMYGAWDAELTTRGTVLVTLFSTSTVQEIDPETGDVVWEFERLKNPFDADVLPSGNLLICDTFGARVVEVDRNGEAVWEFNDNVRPYDADRLPNGHTLIADSVRDRVLEVDRNGKIVWQAGDLSAPHDVERLPNGNTLVTLRTLEKVVEVSPTGQIVAEIEGLSSPSDADRLADGSTIVAENTTVRRFDEAGTETWRVEVTWAVEVNVY